MSKTARTPYKTKAPYPFQKFHKKLMRNFLSNRADRQTNQPTNRRKTNRRKTHNLFGGVNEFTCLM